MSFFKKLGAEFESFMGDKDEKKDEKKDKKDQHGEAPYAERSAGDPYYSSEGQTHGYAQPPPAHQPAPYQQHQQPGYGQAPYQSGPPPTHDYAYGHPPPVPQHPDAHGAPAPHYDGHSQAYYAPPSFPPPQPGAAQLPPGWAARFDENYKSWYYVNEATRVPQWGHPGSVPSHAAVSGTYSYPSVPPLDSRADVTLADRGISDHGVHGAYGAAGAATGYYAGTHAPHGGEHGGHGYPGEHGGHGGEHGYRGDGGHGYSGHGDGHSGHGDGYGGHGDGHYDEHKKKDKKKDKDSNTGAMVAAGAAGLLVGGVAGAVIAHEMSMLPPTLEPQKRTLC